MISSQQWGCGNLIWCFRMPLIPTVLKPSFLFLLACSLCQQRKLGTCIYTFRQELQGETGRASLDQLKGVGIGTWRKAWTLCSIVLALGGGGTIYFDFPDASYAYCSQVFFPLPPSSQITQRMYVLFLSPHTCFAYNFFQRWPKRHNLSFKYFVMCLSSHMFLIHHDFCFISYQISTTAK